MKRVLSLLFALVFVVAAFPVTVASAADVIEISDAAQLAAIGTNDNYPLSGSYKLTKSINLSGYDNWTPIGNGSAFSGTFEGNGKTISGLKVNASGTYAGLFGQVSGTVKNLTVIGSVTLNATSSGATNAYAGIIAGYTSGWATIYSCSTTGEVTATASTSGSGGWFGSGSATVYAGGVVGNHTSMNVIEISAHEGGTVSATANATNSANTTAYAGGVVGKANASIVDCYNVADVSATATGSGGNSNAYSGGILGGGTSNILGSIFGSSTKIATSYNSGDVSATGSSKTVAGAIAGDMGNIKAENCYYLDGCCAAAFGSYSGDTAPSATKLSSSASRKESSYSGFDFESVWTMKLLGTPTHISCDNIITGEVSILGYFEAGQTLKADMSKVEPSSAYDGAIKRVKYQWYVGVENEGEVVYDAISGATKSEYTITNDQIGKYIRLEVKGKRALLAANSYGGVLTSDAGKVTAAVPKNVKVENTDNGIKVTWDKISGASQYTIYRSTYSSSWFGSSFGSYTSVGTATTNSYTDSSVTNNTKYKYKVSVTMNGTESDQSAESAEITASLPCQHQWDSGKETTKATCEATGVKTYTCSVCKGTRTETIPATGHSYSTVSETKATCEKDGTKTVFCSKCFTTNTETTKATGHSYNDGVITTQPNCETAGVKTYTCATCNGTKTENINPTGHSFNAGTIKVQPTCTKEGVKTSTCSRCNVTKDVTIEKTAHKFDGGTVTKQPTCVDAGSKTYKCTVCGTTGTEEVKALGHNFSKEFTIDKPATATETGSKSKHCTRCDEKTEVTVIPKIIITLATPAVTIKNTAKGIEVKWNAIENAENYIVYRRVYNASTKKWSGWSKLKTDYTSTSYVDTTVILGTQYRYTVRAVNGDVMSKYESTETLKYNVTPTVKIANAAKGVKVSWSTAANATGYTVYRSQYSGGKWSGWKNMGTAKANKTAWTDKNVKSGAQYKYTVRACYNKIKSSYKDSNTTVFLTQPTVKFSNSAAGIKVSWSKVTGATGYTVYRSQLVDGKWTKWKGMGTAKSTKTSWTDKKVESGVTYKYTVRACYNTIKSSYTDTKGLLYLAQPNVTVKAVSNGINVAWSQCEGATGYTVYRSEYNTKTKKWSKWSNRGTAKADKTNWTDKKATKGTTYKYTVRAVNADTGAKSSYVASKSVKR